MKNAHNVIDYVVIGAGFSGLFFCNELSRRNIRYLLLEKSISSLGGLAIKGGMKIGLLPAGEKTKMQLPTGQYEQFQAKFLNEYTPYLVKESKNEINSAAFSDDFRNKYYESLLLSKEAGHELVYKLYVAVKQHTIFKEIRSVTKGENGYRISLTDNTVILCKQLVIASGRGYEVYNMLKHMGIEFVDKVDFLFGYRIVFDSKNAKPLFDYQVDFKVKGDENCQNYCFNYRGKIISYMYRNYKVFSGVFDKSFAFGNCFVGKRIQANAIDELIKHPQPRVIAYQNFKGNDYFSEINRKYSGIDVLINNMAQKFDLNITKICFPALEQFWPRLTFPQ